MHEWPDPQEQQIEKNCWGGFSKAPHRSAEVSRKFNKLKSSNDILDETNKYKMALQATFISRHSSCLYLVWSDHINLILCSVSILLNLQTVHTSFWEYPSMSAWLCLGNLQDFAYMQVSFLNSECRIFRKV